MTFHRVCNQINTTGVSSRVGTVHPSGTPTIQWGSCYSIFSFMCMFCRSLFVYLYFVFLSLFCLSFFDLRILINLLISSNSSSVHCRIVYQMTSLILNSQEDSCLIYVMYVCLRIMMSNTYCAVFFVLLVFILCLVYTMMPVFLDCLFQIAPSDSLAFIQNRSAVFPT